jgi:polysaccharide pyruvyl transferase WcaK-like protein
MLKVFFVNDTSDSKNWGCRATTAALRKMVEQSQAAQITHTLFLKRMSLRERYVSSKKIQQVEQMAVTATRHLPVGKSMANYVNTRYLQPVWSWLAGIRDSVPESYTEFSTFANKVIADELFTPEKQALENCDLVVINGEGSIYDRQRKGRMMLFIAYLAKVHFNKPCILVNHTADLRDPVMTDMATQVYPLLDDVIFREPLSAEAGRSLGRSSDDSLAADAAFTYRPIDAATLADVASRDGYFSIFPDSAVGFDPGKPYICVGGSSIYLRADRPAYDPIPGFQDLCKKLQKYVAPVVLTVPCPTDEKIFRPIARSLNLPLIALTTPTQQAVDILGNAAAYISGRWHPSIMALTGGTPIITLTANTYKTQALMQQIELDAPTFDALMLHKEVGDIVDLAKVYLEQGEVLRDQLRNRACRLAAEAQKNVRYLDRL